MSQRLDFLDSARGVAAMYVLIFHSILAFGKKVTNQKNFHFISEEYLYFGKLLLLVFYNKWVVVPYSIISNDKKF
ncbi:MAG: hypothetical protein E2600_08775 [Chryseobacterium sp.]|nr:hypothetical protein [Chryseobacterium sp.]